MMNLPPMDAGVDGRRVGVRVFRLGRWTEQLEIDWCKYLLARSRGLTEIDPPMLTDHNQTVVFFTDLPSICGCFDGEALAQRLTLRHVERFTREGALVICFPLFGLDTQVPTDRRGHEEALTDGGARQWIVTENVPFSEDQVLVEVVPADADFEEEELDAYGLPRSRDSRWDPPVSQTPHAGNGAIWQYANPKLADEAYWHVVIDRASVSGSLHPDSENELERILDDL